MRILLEAILWRNAELGQVERMLRIAKARNDCIPFEILYRAVARLMLFLRNPECERHQGDERNHNQLIEELALVFVILSREPYQHLAAIQLRADLQNELVEHEAAEAIVRAYWLVMPAKDMSGDPTDAPEPPRLVN